MLKTALLRTPFLLALVGLHSMCGIPGSDPGTPTAPTAPQGSGQCPAAVSVDLSKAVPQGTCGAGEVLVQGSLTRDLSSVYSYNGLLSVGPDSSVRVTLAGSHDDVRGDGPAEIITEQLISPVPDFPIAFCLTGSLATTATYNQLILTAEMRQHSAFRTVGDPIVENLYLVTAPSQNQNIQVFGLESCSDPSAGGFCLGPCG
jgi:hypothetical protein